MSRYNDQNAPDMKSLGYYVTPKTVLIVPYVSALLLIVRNSQRAGSQVRRSAFVHVYMVSANDRLFLAD